MSKHKLARPRRKQSPASVDPNNLSHLYIESALQYHVAARYTAFAGFVPVSGFLFHHAIEMYLKAHFCRRLKESQLRKLGHRLRKLWTKFKSEMSDGTLDQFDGYVRELDAFEKIRYPEPVAVEGMTGLIQFAPSTTRGVQGAAGRTLPHFIITVDQLDALAKAILNKCSINPQFFTCGLNPDAMTFLKRNNNSVIW